MDIQEMKFGEKLRQARKKCGFTQDELAKRLCVSRQAVTKWETDAGTPDVQILPMIAKTLNLSIDFLLGITSDNILAELSKMVQLQERLSVVEDNSRYYRSLLEANGIPYERPVIENIKGKESVKNRHPQGTDTETEQETDQRTNQEADQGARILLKAITSDDANRFYGAFWGREDVFSKRFVNKQTGKVGYFTQCNNFWKSGCPKKEKKKISCHNCSWQSYRKLKLSDIEEHLRGTTVNGQEVVLGVYPLHANGTCRFLVYDFDNHEKDAEEADFANTDTMWMEEVKAMREICLAYGMEPLVERSRSGRGAHVWILFKEFIDAALARKFGYSLLQKGAERVNLKSFRYYDRMLPMQDRLPKGSIGNLIALPLQGQALHEGNTAFVDENWNAYPDQWDVLLHTKRYSREFLEQKMKEWGMQQPFSTDENESGDSDTEIHKNTEKPWRKEKCFNKEDVDGKLRITLANGVYIDTSNLAPRIQNRIREMAAFGNPVFYKNQAMGLSNYDQARHIYLGSDENGYIKVPRGLRKSILEKCEKTGIECETDDERNEGREIDVQFCGELREHQMKAVQELLKQDNGILDAAMASGKTVISCYLIAKRKRNTLILIQSSSLMDQWVHALENFLEIAEEPPEYKTPSGQIRRRKSVIGRLQGAHDSTTGIIDIAMVGSVCKKGEFHSRLKEYGLVILDESHHAASDTTAEILKEIHAKYVYGMTATPQRSDGLEKMNEMLIGPICYRYTAKELAKSQGIAHLVYPRFTRAVAPRYQNEKMHPNEAYAIVRDNEDRDNLIIQDVKNCIQEGRTPVILSRFVDHARKLYDRLETSADYVFLLIGEDSKREQRRIIDEMHRVQPQETLILIATGKLIGEGFDFPRLDTLVMASPVAWKGLVAQYAGRLNREYEGKTNVIIYDYVDIHIAMFEKMYYKRLKAYRQIGYDIYQGASAEVTSQKSFVQRNSIFGIDNYFEIYKSDLLAAKKEIILASPAISRKKVDELTALLRERQESGLRVIIVTWKPDRYGYGDSAYWMELQEEMRQNGFEINLAEEYCERYCVIDREVVWYGSVNFLGKEDAEDNLMRVNSRGIAAELLELTFGAVK